MATVRKHYRKWQAVVRVNGHSSIIKSFVSKTDAKLWASLTEVKLRREEAGIAKIKFPKFEFLLYSIINPYYVFINLLPKTIKN